MACSSKSKNTQTKVLANIIVVGCGGTGGKIITELGRFLKGFSSDSVVTHLSLVDGDRVEAKNIERQPFSELDINVEKCLALQEALRECFEFEASAFPIYLDTVEQLEAIIAHGKNVLKNLCSGDERWTYSYQDLTILIGAVDNHRARQILEEVFRKTSSIYYIDSANEYDVGEVVYGLRLKEKCLSESRAYYYPEVLTDTGKRASEMSCGQVNISSPQHIVTNMMAANIVLSAVTQFLQKAVPRTGITYFNAFDCSCVSRAFKAEVDVDVDA